MWMVGAVGYLAMAVVAHAYLARGTLLNDVVSKFLLVGLVSGFLLAWHMLTLYGTALPTFSSIAFYVFACELYIFLFTMVMSSVSAKLLMTLRHTPVSDAKIAGMNGADGMVERRLERLLGAHLLIRDDGRWRLSEKGFRLTKAFIGLKRFFGHPVR